MGLTEEQRRKIRERASKNSTTSMRTVEPEPVVQVPTMELKEGKNGMRAMICEMCGSSDLVKQDGMYVCQYCGTKYTVEEARKLLGTVKIDRSDENEKMLILARRAREDSDNVNAEKYYGKVLESDPNNWEAAFFQVYYRSMQSKIGEIYSAALSVRNSIDTTMRLISELDDVEEEKNARLLVILYSMEIVILLSTVSRNHYKKFSTVDGSGKEYIQNICASYEIYESLERGLKQYFPDAILDIVDVQKQMNLFLVTYRECFKNSWRVEQRKRLTAEIQYVDASYQKPKAERKKGCYVATAVYGSYNCPEVWTLRRYRDNTLATTWYGRCFIYLYYAVSPTLVRLFGRTKWFRSLWKPMLDRMVRSLNEEGVESTPYEDRNW